MTIPPNYQDIATYTPATAKAIVDAAANDPYKEAVRVATAAPLPANTRSGNVLTASINSSINTVGIDGKTDLALNQRVLVKDEVLGANDGIYYVSAIGGVSSKWTLTRGTDADTSAAVKSGMSVFVSEGTTNAGTKWTLTTVDPIVLNTTALVFANTASSVSNATAGAPGAIQLAGDLAGTGSTATVPRTSGINSATVPAAGALTTGNVLQVTGASALGYGPVNLAGGANFVTGVLPGANVVLEKSVVVDFTADAFAGLGLGVTTFDKNVGTALPANARILQSLASSFTGFDDPTHAAYTMTLGVSAGGSEVGTSLNVAAGQTGFPKPFAAGAQGYLLAPHGAGQLQIRLTGGVDLNTVTAGSVTITTYYIVLA